MAHVVSRAFAPTSATFLDTRFRSRVVVFPDGSVLRVIKGEAVAREAQHVEYLDTHPDFNRLEGRV
ncbi:MULTISPECIES: hypothetical protein [Burkholderia]|uniref:hypothetical protein n=1 Tax=Burkholderia TaxID=32008 RepID=UPI0009EB71D1|nr:MULTISPECIES: hypothetical protein [Burkholderia]